MKFLKTMLLAVPLSLGAQDIPWYRAETVEDLGKLNLGRNTLGSAVVTGRGTNSDGGGGIWVYDKDNLRTANGVSVVKPQDVGTTNAGRWLKLDISGLGPQDFYQVLPSTAAADASYAIRLARGIPGASTNIFGVGADNNSAFVQSFSKSLAFNPGGNPITIGPNGAQILALLSATATLDFPSVNASSTATLTISVPGAAVGDTVSVGVPAAVVGGVTFMGLVSAADTVQVRAANVTTGPIDPASGTYRVTVHHFP